jgi:predicted HD phosphohydrolase
MASEMGRPDVTAGCLDDVVEVLRSSRAFDLTVTPGAHHDLLDHSLQTAAVLRRLHPDDVGLQVAGLIHDIGHTLPPRRDDVHAEVAAAFVRPVLVHRIAELVRLHVPAKRYLVTTDPDYRDELDHGSVTSLARQGGDMSAEEILDFESEPHGIDAVVLRRADEAGKIPGWAVPDLDAWIPIMRSQDCRR